MFVKVFCAIYDNAAFSTSKSLLLARVYISYANVDSHKRFINSLKVIASQYGAFIEHFEIKNEGTYINVYVEMSVVGL